MAYYTELKNEFNNNKQTLKNVLNNEGCQFELKNEGFNLLKYLLKKTLIKIKNLNGVDSPDYSYISLNKNTFKTKLNFDDDQLENGLNILKKHNLINIYQYKGGYTGVTYKYISLNFNNFNKFFINTKKYYHPSIVSLVGTY